MATPRIYSEQLVFAIDGGQWHSWSVPAGYRAVVRNVSAANWAAIASRVHVQVGTYAVYVVLHDFPAALGQVSLDTMAVVYAGEPIGIFLDGENVHGQVNGYLFRDVEGKRPAATPLPAPVPLPWPDPPLIPRAEPRGELERALA